MAPCTRECAWKNEVIIERYCYFELQGWKRKMFQKFCPDHVITGIQQLQCYHKWLENKENLSMNIVNQYGEKQNSFAEVAAFCHMTYRYFDRFLLQGVNRNWRQACFFYLALGLICEGYWQVNSLRSIFCNVDPTILIVSIETMVGLGLHVLSNHFGGTILLHLQVLHALTLFCII